MLDADLIVLGQLCRLEVVTIRQPEDASLNFQKQPQNSGIVCHRRSGPFTPPKRIIAHADLLQ